MEAQGPIKQVQIEATVIRADGRVERLGVVSDSKWKWYSPRRWLARRRIERANRSQN